MATADPKVHLVGSLNLPDTESVFTEVGACLGSRIRRVPDGEVGERANWTMWGFEQLRAHEGFQDGRPSPFGGLFLCLRDPDAADQLHIDAPGYAEHARRSYAVFLQQRDRGALPSDARFLVSLPTPYAWVGYVVVEERALVEPLLEAAMLDDLREICAAIPADDLAIQWDVSNEFAILEEVEPSHFDDVLNGCADRLARLVDAVPDGVEIGMHLCYGSYEDTHFIEPKDTAWMVRLVNATLERTARTLTFVHLPVPIERDDAGYFAPLRELRRDRIEELYLGLVHIEDGLPGSARRVAAARTVVDDFGVATECGVGRLDPDTMRPLLELHARTVDDELS